MSIKNLVAIIVATAASAQTGAVIGGGYTTPAPLTVAPGQVVTIFANGVGTKVTQKVSASAFPLPTTLAGISVSFTQLGQGPTPMPLLAVFPSSTCGVDGHSAFGGTCSTLLGITLQIPFELNPNIPGFIGPGNIGEITVSDGTMTTSAIALNPVTDQIHILRYGDTIVGGGGIGPVVTHADGSHVSSANPARVAEELVIYAVGLGKTNPTIKTGDPSPSPPAVLPYQLPLTFDYRPNATPSSMLISGERIGLLSPVIQSTSLFAGLVPGFAGLYQINFQIPAPVGSVPACGSNGVNSNLTVNLIGSILFNAISFDGAEICVTTE